MSNGICHVDTSNPTRKVSFSWVALETWPLFSHDQSNLLRKWIVLTCFYLSINQCRHLLNTDVLLSLFDFNLLTVSQIVKLPCSVSLLFIFHITFCYLLILFIKNFENIFICEKYHYITNLDKEKFWEVKFKMYWNYRN